MGKHLSIAFALVGIAAGTARAESVDPSPTPPSTDPVPTAPGTGPFQKGTLGLGFPVTLLSNVGGGLVLGEPVPTINLLKFLSDKAAIDLIFGLNLHKTTQATGTPPVSEDVTIFGFALGAGYRMYKHKETLHTFIEPSLTLNWVDVSNSNQLSILLAGNFGVERTITDWMSFAGAIGVGLNLANEFKDIKLATQATLSVNLYWK